jgi:hypothetical protein
MRSVARIVRHRGVRTLVAMVAAVAMTLPWPAAVVVAADVTFGTPSATTTYGQSIAFTVPMTAGTAVRRVELRLTFPEALGPYIVDVPVPGGGGTQTLRYLLDLTGDGHLVPNTTIRATWAATTAGGVTVLSGEDTVLYSDTSHDWMTVKGSLMTVHWYQGTTTFANRALAIGEKAIRETSALLGVTETAPVDFFIYADDTSFRTALGPGTRENVGGQAHADIRTLFALITPSQINDAWVSVVVPHELVHLVFDTAVRNPYRFPPRWFNEGLAVYLSEGYTPSDQGLVRAAVGSASLIPLDALGGQFPTDANKTYLAYAESVSAIDYLVRTDGKPALVDLVRAYKDGLTDDEAFTKALGVGLAAFQSGWLQELGAKTPVRYGPQPAPAGPLPPGWGAAGASPVPAAPTAVASSSPAVRPAAGSSGGSEGSGTASVVLALVVVGVLVAAGLLVARRRSQGL